MRPVHLLLGVLLSLPAGVASASLVSCPAGFTADGTALVSQSGVLPKLTAASACQYLTPADQSNVANEANVNVAGFHGVSTWTLLGGVGGPFDQVEPGSGLSGTIDLTGLVDFTNRDYIVVFKDGAGTNLTAFLLNEESAKLDWESPFRNPPFDALKPDQIKDVSHYSVFSAACVGPSCQNPPGGGPGPGTDVPAPATLALLGAALAGLGLSRARRA